MRRTAGLNRIIGVLCIVTSFSAAMGQPASPTGGLNSAVVKLIPPDAAIALVIPSLKSCSDELTQCLEGMDRAQFLLGSRPLDQLKSMSGFNVGVDDLGGLAVVMVERGQTMSPVMLVPVSDAKTFLDGNFAAHDGDRHTRPDGLSVTARDLGSHVAISTDEAAAREFAPQGGLGGAINGEFKAAGRLIDGGELFVFARQNAMETVSTRVRETMRAMGARNMPVSPPCRCALMVIDVDPLAVIVRGLARFDAAALGMANTDSKASVTMTALSGKSFYWAFAANMGSLAPLRSLFADASIRELPSWLWDAQTVHFAAFPSPAGLAGGLLNDSALVVKSNDPNSTRAAIKAGILAIAQDFTDIKREVKWEDSRPVKDVGDAAAFEIRTLDAPPAMAQQQMVEQLFFGRSAVRGFLSTTTDSLLMTFSQRPAVLAGALAALADPEKSLESSPMLTTMRQWMPAQRDVEAYVGVAQLVEMGRQVMQSFGLADGPVPAIDAGAPPVGFAMDVDLSVVESSLILPGPIVAAMLDEAMRQFAAAARTPGVNPEPAEAKDQQ